MLPKLAAQAAAGRSATCGQASVFAAETGVFPYDGTEAGLPSRHVSQQAELATLDIPHSNASCGAVDSLQTYHCRRYYAIGFGIVCRSRCHAAFLLSQVSAYATNFVVSIVATEMDERDRYPFMAGIVGGLAYARYPKDGNQTEVMACI